VVIEQKNIEEERRRDECKINSKSIERMKIERNRKT